MPVVGGAAAPWAARDRFARAWTLGRHHADAGLAALASAWSAHGLLAAGHWKLFAESAVTGLRRARPQDHEALSRWALSLGGACLLANDTDWSQIWFERARRQACAEHDGAALADTLCAVDRGPMTGDGEPGPAATPARGRRSANRVPAAQRGRRKGGPHPCVRRQATGIVQGKRGRRRVLTLPLAVTSRRLHGQPGGKADGGRHLLKGVFLLSLDTAGYKFLKNL